MLLQMHSNGELDHATAADVAKLKAMAAAA
jgi:hypothetical protein